MSGDIDLQIERLYGLPLDEFIAARKALAAQLGAHDREAAARIKSLPKPAASAWAVNQVYWTARREFDALIDASDVLRALQAAGATANELRDAMRERREALSAAMRKAEAALESHGRSVAAATLRRVAANFETLAFYGSARAHEIQPGRLTEDLSPPGFDALAALPAPPPPEPRASSEGRPGSDTRSAAVERRAAEEERTRSELTRLENEVSARRRQAEAARAATEEARRRAEGAISELAEAERRLAKATARATEAASAAEQAQGLAARAASELAAAEAALDRARRSLPSP